MKVQELLKMMYPDIRVQIQTKQKNSLYKGIVKEVPEEFFEKEIHHVWGQADLDGMKITIEDEKK